MSEEHDALMLVLDDVHDRLRDINTSINAATIATLGRPSVHEIAKDVFVTDKSRSHETTPRSNKNSATIAYQAAQALFDEGTRREEEQR